MIARVPFLPQWKFLFRKRAGQSTELDGNENADSQSFVREDVVLAPMSTIFHLSRGPARARDVGDSAPGESSHPRKQKRSQSENSWAAHPSSLQTKISPPAKCARERKFEISTQKRRIFAKGGQRKFKVEMGNAWDAFPISNPSSRAPRANSRNRCAGSPARKKERWKEEKKNLAEARGLALLGRRRAPRRHDA